MFWLVSVIWLDDEVLFGSSCRMLKVDIDLFDLFLLIIFKIWLGVIFIDIFFRIGVLWIDNDRFLIFRRFIFVFFVILD